PGGGRAVAAGLESPLLAAAATDLADLEPLRGLLAAALADEPPLTLHDGGIIRETWNAALAAIVDDARQARDWIAGLEERERARTRIPSLRVRFNRVFGYGIEVTHAHVARVPPEYIRRQTLTGAERYVTAELKEYEAKVLGADERRRRIEYELFEEVRSRVAARASELLTTARALARLDALAALAAVAHARGPVRPVVSMAQMGAFVPAREARIGVIDRIFTRVGAQDNLARGQSTFLVEMVETATILNNVTPRSLVLLDEVGRGTSTFDGLAIAWAVVEALHERGRGAKVLFATHFHELTRLAGRLPGVRNFHVAVREWNDEIIFLHKVEPGATDRSYGIQVAAYEFDSADHGAALFDLETPGYRYSRIANPTTDVLERRVAALENGVEAMSVSSGQAALNYAVLNVTQLGSNIVSVPQLYGTTHTLFAHLLPGQGVTVRFAESDQPDAIERLIDDKTKAVFCESVGNPAGNICDIGALAYVAHRHGVPLIVDNTVASPILLRPIEHGADVV